MLRTNFPPILDFVENTSATIEFFEALRKRTLEDPADVVIVDHSKSERISPESALVLIAELVRAHEIRHRRCRLKGTGPINPKVDDLLGQIGFFKYFKSSRGWRSESPSSKIFMHHRSGDHVDQFAARDLIQHFVQANCLSTAQKKALYIAIVECLNNVLGHAYPESYKALHLKNRWWMLGSRNAETHEISFCFYDQGAGIPGTIRTRIKDKVPLFSASDSEILIKAVEEGHYSSTQNPTRGKGLPRLKAFLDQAASGELVIVTHRSKCIFTKGMAPRAEETSRPLPGTLIVWTFRSQ